MLYACTKRSGRVRSLQVEILFFIAPADSLYSLTLIAAHTISHELFTPCFESWASPMFVSPSYGLDKGAKPRFEAGFFFPPPQIFDTKLPLQL
jgi:hypothetical protein